MEELFLKCFANLPSCEVELNHGGKLCLQPDFHTIFRDLEITDLSPREREILELLASGDFYKEIAEKLDTGVTTVRSQIQHIYDKLHVRTRTETQSEPTRMTHGSNFPHHRITDAFMPGFDTSSVTLFKTWKILNLDTNIVPARIGVKF